MRQPLVRNGYRGPRVVPFIGHKEPGLLDAENRSSQGSTNIVEIEIRSGIFADAWGRHKIRHALFVLYLQGRQGRVLIVVKSRAVKLRFAALSGDANIANSRIFGAEIGGENIELANGLQRRLTGGRRTENRVGGPLAVDCKIGAITLEAQELEFAILNALRNIRVQVKE